MVEGFISAIDAAASAATKGTLRDFQEADRITISSTNDDIIVSAFGGRLGIKTTVSNNIFANLNYHCKNEGKVTVNAKDMMKVLESFIPEETVIFQTKKNTDSSNIVNELCITMLNDAEQYQTLPCYDTHVNLPEVASSFLKTIEIGKDAFIYGVNKVIFAAGNERTKPLYLNVLLSSSDDEIKFSAGTGSRHVLLYMDGKKIVKANPKKTSILIPKDALSVFTHVLNNVKSDVITIKESDRKGNAPFQIVVECGEQQMVLVGLDSSLKWVDESPILDIDYPNKFVTRLSDWSYASKGTHATFNEQFKREGSIHKAQLDIDLAKKQLFVKTNAAMRSSRKVTIIDHKFGDESEVDYSCVSSYLQEISSIVDNDEGFVQIELMKATKPIIVYHYASKKITEDTNDIRKEDEGNGFSERLIMIFGTYSS